MVNKNYNRGRRKEYGVCERLRKEGWIIVQRSSGSHSPVDVFAIHKEDKKIKFIQVKAGLLSSGEQTKIYNENEWLNGKFEVEFDIEN